MHSLSLIVDDGFEHLLTVVQDSKSGGLRLHAAVRNNELRKCPVWTAFGIQRSLNFALFRLEIITLSPLTYTLSTIEANRYRTPSNPSISISSLDGPSDQTSNLASRFPSLRLLR